MKSIYYINNEQMILLELSLNNTLHPFHLFLNSEQHAMLL